MADVGRIMTDSITLETSILPKNKTPPWQKDTRQLFYVKLSVRNRLPGKKVIHSSDDIFFKSIRLTSVFAPNLRENT